MNKFKVLMVIGQFYPIVGGAENQAKELSENLLKRKVAVDVLTIHRWGQKIVDKLDRINIYRVTFYSFGIIKYYLSLLEILIYVLVRGRNYACIHIHGGNEIAYWATKAAKARRIPTIVKIVNSEQRFDLSLLCQKGYNINIFIHDVSYFIATTPRIVEQLIEKSVPEKKIKLIPNGVRILEHLNNNRIIENLSENPLKIILVARLVPQKNIIFILNVAKLLQIPFRIAIYGDGVLKESLNNYIAKNNLSDNVSLMGNVDSIKLRRIISQSDVFVLPSFVEGLSNALLEAISVGTPVLLTDLLSNRYVVGKELYSCCLGLDVNLWKNKLEYLYFNTEYRKHIGSKLIIRSKHFNISSIAEKYFIVYDHLKNT